MVICCHLGFYRVIQGYMGYLGLHLQSFQGLMGHSAVAKQRVQVTIGLGKYMRLL